MSERRDKAEIPAGLWVGMVCLWLVAFAASMHARWNGDHLTRIEQKVDRIAAEVRE